MTSITQLITLTLPRYVWETLLSAARALRSKRKREMDAHPFVPEPGKRNANEEQVRKLNEAISAIERELAEKD